MDYGLLSTYTRQLGYQTPQDDFATVEYLREHCETPQNLTGDLQKDTDKFLQLNIATGQLKPVFCVNDDRLVSWCLTEFLSKNANKNYDLSETSRLASYIMQSGSFDKAQYLAVKGDFIDSATLKADLTKYAAKKIATLWDADTASIYQQNLAKALETEKNYQFNTVSKMYSYTMHHVLNKQMKEDLDQLMVDYPYITGIRVDTLQQNPAIFVLKLHTEAGIEPILITPHFSMNLASGESLTPSMGHSTLAHPKCFLHAHRKNLKTLIHDMVKPVQFNARKETLLDKPLDAQDQKRLQRMVQLVRAYPTINKKPLKIVEDQDTLVVSYGDFSVRLHPYFVAHASYNQLIAVRDAQLTPAQSVQAVFLPALQKAALPTEFAKYVYQVYAESVDLRKKKMAI